MLARFGETTVITRSNNRDVIEAALPELSERDRLRFQYVDLPAWARRWKRGRRGIHLYYLIWQVAAYRRARQLLRTETFDLTWHLTLANAWLGSGAALLRLPFIYGPVGGGVTVPWRLLPALGMRGLAYEAVRAVTRGTGRYLNPLARLAWRRAGLILVQNKETGQWFPNRHRAKTEVFPNVILEDMPHEGPGRPESGRKASQIALYAGRLLPWKGVSLAIRALEWMPGWRLMIAGAGHDRGRLERVARSRGVQGRVTFLGMLQREHLLQLMERDVDVMVYPSLREEAGWAVAEASSYGIRVPCIDLGGPPLVGGSPVHHSTPAMTAKALALRSLELTSDGRRVRSLSLPSTEAYLRTILERRKLASFVPSLGHLVGSTKADMVQ
jgi:glycosyltransferase involved in cell wall biosynthesis